MLSHQVISLSLNGDQSFPSLVIGKLKARQYGNVVVSKRPSVKRWTIFFVTSEAHTVASNKGYEVWGLHACGAQLT